MSIPVTDSTPDTRLKQKKRRPHLWYWPLLSPWLNESWHYDSPNPFRMAGVSPTVAIEVDLASVLHEEGTLYTQVIRFCVPIPLAHTKVDALVCYCYSHILGTRGCVHKPAHRRHTVAAHSREGRP